MQLPACPIFIPRLTCNHIANSVYVLIVKTDQNARWLGRVFEALSDPQRVRILCLLEERAITVSAIVNVLHIVQPVVSRQLARLRKAQLVETKREGKWILYSLERPSNEAALAVLLEALKQMQLTKQTRTDLRRLAWQCKRSSSASEPRLETGKI